MSRISVIIPTRKRPHLLPRAVASAQTAGSDVEVIVVDDASTDQTAEVCRDLTGIKYIRLERNQGVAGARNVGLLNSGGKYIAFLDDDDLRLPGSLDIQRQVLEANSDAGMVCGGMIMAHQTYEPSGEIISPRDSGDVFWKMLELDFPVMPLSTLIRKECFLRIGLLRRRLNGIDDWDIFVRIAELYPVLVIDQPVGVYRKPTAGSGQGSSSQARQLRRAAQHQLQLCKLPRVVAAGSTRRSAIRRSTINRLADTLLLNAARRFIEREYKAAFSNLYGAMRINPLRAARPRVYSRLAKTLFSGTG